MCPYKAGILTNLVFFSVINMTGRQIKACLQKYENIKKLSILVAVGEPLKWYQRSGSIK